MHLRNTIVPAIPVLALILVAAGCASAPPPPPADTPPPAEPGSTTGEAQDAPAAGDANATIRFHVDGPGTDEGSCALRFYALHDSGLAPLDVELQIETFRVSDGILVSGTADSNSFGLPMMTAVETVDGMESPVWSDDLLLPCGDLRSEIRVVSCDPSPCPSLGVQPGYNLVPLTVIGPDAG